jgi:hypothetical protein
LGFQKLKVQKLKNPSKFIRVKVGPYIIAKDINEIKDIEEIDNNTQMNLKRVSTGGTTYSYIGIVKKTKDDGQILIYPKKV